MDTNQKINDEIIKLANLREVNNYSWSDIADVVNNVFGTNFSGDACRLRYKRKCKFSCLEEDSQEEDFSQNINYEDLMLELEKVKVQIRDERTANNAYIRRLSREDSIKEIATNYAEIMADNKPLLQMPIITHNQDAEKHGILLLSDWHYGIEINNFWNVYSPEICKNRINKLLKQTIEIIVKENISKLHVVNLSDLIAGRIHTQIRIESRFDVITQAMDVAEILAEFLTCLSGCCEISYYDCLDNHSRIEPNKKESLQLESLVRMIPWYLKSRLSDNFNISIKDNYFAEDIITFDAIGHHFGGVHGDNDKMSSVVQNLTLMTKEKFDAVFTAHKHHFSADERNECIVISNPSLMGTDSYAEKLRLSSHAAQTFIVVTKDNPINNIYRIVLD